MSRTYFVVIIALLCCSTTIHGATLSVRQDGSGDYTTISAAVAAAVDGDAVEVGPGSYLEVLLISKSIDLIAENGPGSTNLDGGGTGRPVEVSGPYNVTIQGFTFQNGFGDEGVALFIWHGATVLVENCAFVDNFATGSNAVHARHSGTSVTITGCDFLRNRANVHSAALSVNWDAYLDVSNCVFADNEASGHGAVNALDATMNVSGCLFLRNRGGGTGALVCQASTGEVWGNTFHGNSGTNNGSVYIDDGTSFHHNIITDEQAGFGLVYLGYGSRSCNIFWGNTLGSTADGSLIAGEMYVEPQFCDFTLDNFSLCQGSPALGEDTGCGLIGAFGVGCSNCGPVPEEKRAWGDIKAMYR